MTYIASAPLVIVRLKSGSDAYVYGGFELPADVNEDTVAGLVSEGLVVEVKSAAVERPAESGPGSAKEKWIEFAAQEGIEIDPESDKSDIIAAVTAAGK